MGAEDVPGPTVPAFRISIRSRSNPGTRVAARRAGAHTRLEFAVTHPQEDPT